MQSDFIEEVKVEYDDWKDREKKKVKEYNSKLESQIETYKRLRELLKRDDVREFAKLINYQEESIPSFKNLDISLYHFLRTSLLIELNNIPLSKIDKYDKYPVFCFLGTKDPIYGMVSKKQLRGYCDAYYSLDNFGYLYEITDKSKNDRTNRDKFIRNHDIIYDPTGENFSTKDEFCKIQAEYIEEALTSNEANAKSLILSKYGRK